MDTRNGILSGGNWIVDRIKMIDTYPDENALANILEEKSANGGAPFNLLTALRKMGVKFPLEGIGAVGDDANGEEVLRQCRELSIDTHQLKVKKDSGTSFTDVMTVADSGKRTFFHHRGASALLGIGDFDFSLSRAKFFHLGYLLLLDELDRIDENGRSGASKVLEKASDFGFITSADIVSEQSDRYQNVIPSSLPFIDILFLNELEAKGLTGIEVLTADGKPLVKQVKTAAEIIHTMGVRKWVVLHFPAGAIAVHKDGQMNSQTRVNFPPSMIRGTVGAGDAFAAGVLAGLHDDLTMQEALKSGVCVAAASLLSPTASDSILAWSDCLALGEKWGFAEE